MHRTPPAPSRRPNRDRAPRVRWGQDPVTRENRRAFARAPVGAAFTYDHGQGRARTGDFYRVLAFSDGGARRGFVVRVHFAEDPLAMRLFRLRDVGPGAVLVPQNPDGAVRPWRAPLAEEPVFDSESSAHAWADGHAAWREAHPGTPSELVHADAGTSFWQKVARLLGIDSVGNGVDT